MEGGWKRRESSQGNGCQGNKPEAALSHSLDNHSPDFGLFAEKEWTGNLFGNSCEKCAIFSYSGTETRTYAAISGPQSRRIVQFQQKFHAASCLSCCTAANWERRASARRSRRFTQIWTAGLNRRTQREQSFSLFPPFPPVRKNFICVNLRQSAGNSGFACGFAALGISRFPLPSKRWNAPDTGSRPQNETDNEMGFSPAGFAPERAARAFVSKSIKLIRPCAAKAWGLCG